MCKLDPSTTPAVLGSTWSRFEIAGFPSGKRFVIVGNLTKRYAQIIKGQLYQWDEGEEPQLVKDQVCKEIDA